MKKVELIRCYYGDKKIVHATSTGEREVGMSKRNDFSEVMAYVEKYINENGFSIKSMDKEPQTLYFLIEKDV